MITFLWIARQNLDSLATAYSRFRKFVIYSRLSPSDTVCSSRSVRVGEETFAERFQSSQRVGTPDITVC